MRGLACVLLLVPLAWRGATADEPAAAKARSMPAWAAAMFQRPDFAGRYALSTRLDPSLLQGDFDGDGRLDVAALVSRRGTGASGIAILHAGAAQPLVVGAGHPLGNGGDDFSWMDAWSVVARASLDRGDREARAPRPRGDAILVEKREAASALVYWDGAAYRWRQQGD